MRVRITVVIVMWVRVRGEGVTPLSCCCRVVSLSSCHVIVIASCCRHGHVIVVVVVMLLHCVHCCHVVTCRGKVGEVPVRTRCVARLIDIMLLS